MDKILIAMWIVVTLAIVSVVIFVVSAEYEYADNLQDFCEKEGYEGYIDQILSKYNKCYKDVDNVFVIKEVIVFDGKIHWIDSGGD